MMIGLYFHSRHINSKYFMLQPQTCCFSVPFFQLFDFWLELHVCKTYVCPGQEVQKCRNLAVVAAAIGVAVVVIVAVVVVVAVVFHLL